MNIEIKKSKKPVNYFDAISYLEERAKNIIKNNEKELIWILEHPSIYTGGTTYNEKDILDKSIKIIKTNRGGKITWHVPGQLIFYLVIDLNKRKKDIRKFIKIIEKSIIDALKEFNISSYSDRNNVGIWININGESKKIGAIGIKVKKWIAYHGFSLNINNDLSNYSKIIPCGIKDKKISNLIELKNEDFSKMYKIIIKNLCFNLKI